METISNITDNSQAPECIAGIRRRVRAETLTRVVSDQQGWRHADVGNKQSVCAQLPSSDFKPHRLELIFAKKTRKYGAGMISPTDGLSGPRDVNVVRQIPHWLLKLHSYVNCRLWQNCGIECRLNFIYFINTSSMCRCELMAPAGASREVRDIDTG